jgi:hypothetical protein
MLIHVAEGVESGRLDGTYQKCAKSSWPSLPPIPHTLVGRNMGLVTAVWQKLVWCGLIGGVAGLIYGIAGIFRPAQGQPSLPLDLTFDTLTGTLLGLILLGVPATLWITGKWLFHRGKPPADTTQRVVRGAGHAAMAGSTAAVPGAILGVAGGLVLAAVFVGCIHFVSEIIGADWYADLSRHLVACYSIFAFACGLTGFLAGTFLGSAAGAIIGGIRSLSRH